MLIGHVVSILFEISVRRGYEVYKNVCAACHGLKYVSWRHLIGMTHTDAEAKAEAAQATVQCNFIHSECFFFTSSHSIHVFQ